jgi:hypothetical protein
MANQFLDKINELNISQLEFEGEKKRDKESVHIFKLLIIS